MCLTLVTGMSGGFASTYYIYYYFRQSFAECVLKNFQIHTNTQSPKRVEFQRGQAFGYLRYSLFIIHPVIPFCHVPEGTHSEEFFSQTVMGKCSVPTKRPSPKRRRRTGPATYRAVRADEAAHVLDDTEQFEAGAATEGHLAADVPHGQVLRSGDQHTAVTAERPDVSLLQVSPL